MLSSARTRPATTWRAKFGPVRANAPSVTLQVLLPDSTQKERVAEYVAEGNRAQFGRPTLGRRAEGMDPFQWS